MAVSREPVLVRARGSKNMNAPGFCLFDNVISENTEWRLIEKIVETMAKVRINPDERDRSRVLRFGYDYQDKDVWLGEPPAWTYEAIGYSGESVTINEYGPGHGIRPHVDSLRFDDQIRILNLGSQTTIQLISPANDVMDVFVPRRSVTLLVSEVRRTWKHGIESRGFDMTPEGIRVDRGTRYSIVYRTRLAKSLAKPVNIVTVNP